MKTKTFEELDELPLEVLMELSGKCLAPYVIELRKRNELILFDMRNGFRYATSKELAAELGATEETATAFHIRLERLAGKMLKLLRP